MPTVRGLLVATLGTGLIACGRLLGVGPAEQLGWALVALTGCAAVVVRAGRQRLEVSRSISPARTSPGRPVEVEVAIANRGRRAAPLLLLEDRLPPGLAGAARFALEGVEPGGVRTARVSLRPSRRGRYRLGPLSAAVVDPFGLARVRRTLLGTTDLLVRPAFERLPSGPEPGERRAAPTGGRRRPSGERGEDFYTLREYVEGDDLRKVHWGATAKRGRYMIRQEETPWHNRAVVLLDDRTGPHGGLGPAPGFERAVEAAAALCDLHRRNGYSFRLATVSGGLGPPGGGGPHLERCLDALATAEIRRCEPDALAARLAEAARWGPQAALVLVSGTLQPIDATALGRCRASFGAATVVCFPAHRHRGTDTRRRWEGERAVLESGRLLGRAGVRTLVLGPDESLAAAWGGSAGRSAWARKPAPA